MKKVLSIYLIHWAIFFTYFIPTTIKFIYEKSANPTGHGMLLWLFMLFHIYGGIFWIGKYRRKKSRSDAFITFTALLLPIILFIIFSNPVYELLWKWRGD